LLYITLNLPDPDNAMANLFRYVEAGGGREAVFSLISQSERVFETLLKLFGTSDYLSGILIHRPDVFETIIQSGALTRSKSPEDMISEFRSAIHGISTAQSRFGALADAKRDEEFAIGMRSILGEADILVTVSDLTLLADTVLKIGLSIAQEELNNLYGAPSPDDAPPGFAVIGLGKLGSLEMNFGSDLDLIFVYDGSKGETTALLEEKKSKRDAIPNPGYFYRLGTLLREGLASPEVGERIYEIDLRLRPDGQTGSLVTPLEQMEVYLKERAEIWERQALCRARFIAGAPEVGEAFMRLVSHFVYETPVPNNFAGQVDHMRKRMEFELARETEENIDIKLGAGGIADIEFTVQYLQIMNGGKNPLLRRPDSAGAIQALQKAGLISKKNGDALLEAYRFLRLVENRLRIANAQSIHTLPKTPAEMEILARRIGYEDNVEGSSRAKLLSDYEKHTQLVRKIYNEIVAGVDEVPGEK
jgi:glutamate-ammonia-ligase adenylyltransferase